MSRFSELLKRSSSSEPETEEKQEDTMTDKKLNLDLDGLSGNQPQMQQAPEEDNPFTKKTPLRKLTKPTFEQQIAQTWICFPVDGKLKNCELETCSAEDFCAWLVYLCPQTAEHVKKYADSYQSYNKRKTEFNNVVKFFERMKEVFKSYGESFAISSGKKDKVKEKDNE